jgi:hypothetical protein
MSKHELRSIEGAEPLPWGLLLLRKTRLRWEAFGKFVVLFADEIQIHDQVGVGKFWEYARILANLPGSM